MIRPATSIASVLALGAIGATLLAGCGGATKTVSVSGASAPAATAQTTAKDTNTTPPTTTTSTTPAPTNTTTADTGGQSAGGRNASTTRTAPAPAFTHTATRSEETAARTQAAAAADLVAAHGYTPTSISDYHPTQTLRVLVGARTGSADSYDQRAFFFLDGRYIGTDSSQPSASIHIVSQSDTEVALAYSLYRAHDSLCCPSGGQAVVHFQLNNGALVPLQPIPPASSATGLARQ